MTPEYKHAVHKAILLGTFFDCVADGFESHRVYALTPMIAANEYRKQISMERKTRVLVSRPSWLKPLNIDVDTTGTVTLVTEEGYFLATTNFEPTFGALQMNYSIHKEKTTACIYILALAHAPESEAGRFREAHSWLCAEAQQPIERFDNITAYSVDIHRLPDLQYNLGRLGFKESVS